MRKLENKKIGKNVEGEKQDIRKEVRAKKAEPETISKVKPKLSPEEQERLNEELAETIVFGKKEGKDEEEILEKIENLVNKGADVNTTEHLSERIPLVLAIGTHSPKFIRFLLDKGADVNFWQYKNTEERKSPLFHAVYNYGYGDGRHWERHWSLETIKILLDAGASMKTPREEGFPFGPLDWAVVDRSRYPEILRLLLDRGIDVEEKNHALGFACHYCSNKSSILQAIKTLLEAGADPNATAYYGKRALDIAKTGLARIEEYLAKEPEKEYYKECIVISKKIIELLKKSGTKEEGDTQ